MKSYRHYLRRLPRRIGWGTLLIGAIPLVLALLWLRFLGLPAPAKAYLMAEVERRHLIPFPIAVDRLLIDPTGAILAERLTVFSDMERQHVMLQVDRVRIGIAWLSWWRGRGLIDRAQVVNAEVKLPVGPQDTADFEEVNADASFDGRDIKIQNAQARILNLILSVRGTIHNDGFPKTKPPTLEALVARQEVWRKAAGIMDEIGTENPIGVDLEFEAASHDLSAGHANFSLVGRHLTWRTAPVSELSVHGSLSDRQVTLSDFKIGLDRGELTAYGEWNLESRSAELSFTSSLDFTSLAPAFQGPAGEALRRLDFPNTSPAMNGRVLFDFQHGFHADLQTDLDWRDFTFNGVAFRTLSVPLAYDGHRLLIPGLKVEGDAGGVDLEMFFDSTGDKPDLNAKLNSTLDPTILKGVFGEGMDSFLGSCAFPAGGPQIEATASGTALQTDAWTIKGKMAAEKFIYKNAAFDGATSDFTFANSTLNLPNLAVQRPEGTGTGTILYDFKNHAVELHNVVTQLNVAEVAPVMGVKFTGYTKPYHFTKPPRITVNGKVDLQSEKKHLDTDLTVDLAGQSPMEWTLFKIPFVFESPVGRLVFKDRTMNVNMKQCGFYGGSLTGTMQLEMEETPATYVLDLNLGKVDFRKFMSRVFSYNKSTGSLVVQTHLTGTIGQMETMGGSGEVWIDDGDITQIPFLGSLTPLIPGFSAADSSHSHFTAAKGLIHTDDLDISSETFALIGNGNYDFIKDQVDLDMRVNAKTVFGILLYPISKIFEFHGTGPMKNVVWQPKNF